MGSPSRECVDEPSLPKESGRGALSNVARSKSSSSRAVLVRSISSDVDAGAIRVAGEVIRPSVECAFGISPPAFECEEDVAALPVPVEAVEVGIQRVIGGETVRARRD